MTWVPKNLKYLDFKDCCIAAIGTLLRKKIKVFSNATLNIPCNNKMEWNVSIPHIFLYRTFGEALNKYLAIL